MTNLHLPSRLKWDLRFLSLATLVASWSKDPSTQCGAVVTHGKRIVSLGFNGFPTGCSDDHAVYNNREVKYERILHAEQNAILFAQSELAGCTIYTYPFPPCARCTAVIIQVGISTIVSYETPKPQLLERWKDSLEISQQMCKEADVNYLIYDKSNMVQPEGAI